MSSTGGRADNMEIVFILLFVLIAYAVIYVAVRIRRGRRGP